MGCGLYCWFALSVWVCLGFLCVGYGFDLMVLSLNLDALPLVCFLVWFCCLVCVCLWLGAFQNFA